MKKSILFIAIIFAFVACKNNNTFDELPRPISRFISQYWPDPDIESYTQPTAGNYVVVIKNGPSVVFDEEYSWTDIEGNGMPLPQTLLYDQLPNSLYDYIESIEDLDCVFSISRDAREYYVTLLYTNLIYDIASGSVKEVDQKV